MRILLALPALFALAMPAAAESGARWGARDPVACTELVQAEPPTADQAAQLFKCANERVTSSDELWLMEKIQLQIAGPRPFADFYESLVMEYADTTKPVYPLRGSWVSVVCRPQDAVKITGGDPALNCRETDLDKGIGACWLTTFGDWRCAANGTIGTSRANTAPPK